MLATTRTCALTAALGLAVLAMPATGQAAPALDTALPAANRLDVTRVQYGESYQHYRYRRAHAAYRQAHRAYRAERRYRYGY